MKVLFFLYVLLWFCSSVSTKVQPDKPYLNEVKNQSINQSAVERLSPYSNNSESGDVASFTSDFQDVIGTLQVSYMRCLDTLTFDNCHQPKFFGIGGLSPPIFPMSGGSSSMNYAKCDMNVDVGGWMVILSRTNRPGRDPPYWETAGSTRMDSVNCWRETIGRVWYTCITSLVSLEKRSWEWNWC